MSAENQAFALKQHASWMPLSLGGNSPILPGSAHVAR